MEESKHSDQYKIVLLGNTGAGKSTTGNMLSGSEVFLVGDTLRSETDDTNST